MDYLGNGKELGSEPKNVNLPRNTDDDGIWSSAKYPKYKGEKDSRSCYYQAPGGSGDDNEPAVQEKFDRLDFDKPDENEVDGSCYYRVPRSGIESQSQEAMDYQDDISTQENEGGKENQGRRSCFYRGSR